MPSTDVGGFMARHVRSLDDLQVLMQCIDSPDRWWDAAAMARETGFGVNAAREVLDHLARGNLLDIKITGDVRYSFAPGTPALQAAALDFAAAYRARPVEIVQFVAGTSRRHLRDFANAFRIRRHDDR
jgi:hypothetical protein